MSTSSSPRPGCGRTTRCSATPRLVAGCRSGARSSWPGSCADRRGAPWLAVTGTNGKTTTVRMLESMLRAAGLRALAVGNVGVSVIDAVLAPPALRRAAPSSCPATSCTGRRPCVQRPARCSTSRPTTSTGTARCRPTSRPRRGVGGPDRDRQRRRRPRSPRCSPRRRRDPRRGHAWPRRSPGQLGVATASWSTGLRRAARSSFAVGRRAPVRAPQRHQRALRRRRSPDRQGVAGRGRGRPGYGTFQPDPHRNQLVDDAGRRALGGRQQGDEPARRRRVARRPTTRRVDRRWPAEGRAGRRSGRAVRVATGRRGAARRRPRDASPPHSRDTRRMCR